jgi:hypothetical protein
MRQNSLLHFRRDLERRCRTWLSIISPTAIRIILIQLILTSCVFTLVARAEKGVATYTLSPNRQRLFPNFWHTAIFNTFRRFRHQVLYVAPPFIVAYSLMDWAVERYVRYAWWIEIYILVPNVLTSG